MKTEDGYIVHECLNGDKSAFAILIDKYKAAVFAIAYDKLRNFHDAQDVAQEVFIKAFQKLSTLKNYDKFAVWIHSITNNLCKNYIRSQSRRPDREFIEDQDKSTIDSRSMESFKDDIENEMINDALNSLPEIYRQVITLHYLGGMKDSEIAEFLGMSHTNVRQKLMKARTQLKEEMISMMDKTFEEQRLQAGFTFRLVEMVKRIKIHPITQARGLPWGLSLAVGLIGFALSINPHLINYDLANFSSFLSSSSKAKVLEVGEIPVNIINISQIPNISKGISEGKGSEQPDMQNALLMAPQEGIAKWEKKTDMPTARYTYTAEVNDKIYVIGGSPDDANVLSTVEEYNPATNEWVKKASMPKPRALFGIGVANGKIYVIGGNRILMGKEPLSTVEEYDPVADIWTTKADMSTPRLRLCAAGVNGKIYAIAGDNLGIANGGPVAFVEEYNPVLDKWTKKADIPTPRNRFSTCVLNGKIYAIGGSPPGADIALSSIEEYDPVTDTWTKKRDMPTPRVLACSAAVNGKIYVMGGANIVNGQIVVLSSVEKYDPIKDEWTKEKDMPIEAGVQYASVVDGKIYAIGGMTRGWTPLQAVLEYTPADQDDPSYSISPQGKLPNTWGKIKAK